MDRLTNRVNWVRTAGGFAASRTDVAANPSVQMTPAVGTDINRSRDTEAILSLFVQFTMR